MDNSSYRRLLQITEDLIREKGCQRTTLAEIMNRTGLSKGAIYHYVSGKDELFGLILKERTKEVNRKFQQAVDLENPELENPLRAIEKGTQHIMDREDITNLIFIYLLSRQEVPTVSRILKEVYQYSEQASIAWIEAGQQAGVIPSQLDVKKTAAMLMTYSYGMRVMAMVSPESFTLTSKDYYQFMLNVLEGKKE
ncbi:TetR/AcrR family transcriptional regulator [Melghirimyces algeriensis]|uniref:Transcriptional regulator, TetR family n=1 Tax=Melghirimyces algeriensis TaxID=910412 RepID=A0A521CDX9_9BACL|nr:TetR/AcrR family transcriptional regulator [Melghirimyces algeriensis]SMO56970.1 transcriptional regulator, TetR family [Melghirimyces algeriensis]